MIYILEAIVIVGALYLFFRNRESVNLNSIKELKLDIKGLKDKINEKEKIILDIRSTTKDTSYIRDEIKKRKKLHEEITRLHKTVEDTKYIAQNASMIKSDFLSNVGHEIRTPMNSILVFAELLEKEISDKKLSTFANNILQSGNKLLVLFDKIIELSKIESGNFEIVESAVDIKNFFDTQIEAFKNEANKKGLDLSVEIDENVPESLMIDPVRVDDILNNLIANAIKFTHKGYVKVFVAVDKEDEINNVVDISISVKDSGIGIVQKNQDKIFEIFETKENSNSIEYPGTGLGLSINRKLSKLMNGSLVVESELSKGSVFTLTLSGVEVVLSSSKKNIDESKIDFGLIKPSGATILVVDNSEENLDLVKESFFQTSTKVLDFNNARNAIEALKKQEVDLILIDVDMLSIDDGAVSKVMKTVTKAPVITLTSTRLKDIVFQDGGIKPIGHLKKPLVKIELFKILLKILNSQVVVFEDSGDIIVDNKDDDMISNNINPIQLKMFLHAQNNGLEKLYVEAIATNDLNAIKSFAIALLDLCVKYKIKSLINYSNLLLEKIDLFDIEAINIMLSDYKDKIAKFEATIKK